jgi:hypothetical protein
MNMDFGGPQYCFLRIWEDSSTRHNGRANEFNPLDGDAHKYGIVFPPLSSNLYPIASLMPKASAPYQAPSHAAPLVHRGAG